MFSFKKLHFSIHGKLGQRIPHSEFKDSSHVTEEWASGSLSLHNNCILTVIKQFQPFKEEEYLFYIQGPSSYGAVNPLLGYKNQSVNTV
jgi:hypothetical protein